MSHTIHTRSFHTLTPSTTVPTITSHLHPHLTTTQNTSMKLITTSTTQTHTCILSPTTIQNPTCILNPTTTQNSTTSLTTQTPTTMNPMAMQLCLPTFPLR